MSYLVDRLLHITQCGAEQALHPNQVRRPRHLAVPDGAGPVGPLPRAAGRGGAGGAVGGEGAARVLPRVAHLGREGRARAPLQGEAGAARRPVHQEPGRKNKI